MFFILSINYSSYLPYMLICCTNFSSSLYVGFYCYSRTTCISNGMVPVLFISMSARKSSPLSWSFLSLYFFSIILFWSSSFFFLSSSSCYFFVLLYLVWSSASIFWMRSSSANSWSCCFLLSSVLGPSLSCVNRSYFSMSKPAFLLLTFFSNWSALFKAFWSMSWLLSYCFLMMSLMTFTSIFFLRSSSLNTCLCSVILFSSNFFFAISSSFLSLSICQIFYSISYSCFLICVTYSLCFMILSLSYLWSDSSV